MNERLYLSPPHMGNQELDLVTKAFSSNWIAPTGPMVDLFEQRLADVTGIKHVAAVSSGSAALHLALRIAGVREGDEIWCPTLTFIGGVAPILYERGQPFFFDSDNQYLIDLDYIEEELELAARENRLPNVLITTDLYGNTVDIDRMKKLSAQFGFKWISDSAEALGSTWRGHHSGRGADFTIFSFNGNKIITTSGGGALASDNPEAIAQAVFLSTQAREAFPHYEHKTYGYNYRLSNICAAIGVGQLAVLGDRVAARRAIFEKYRRRLGHIPGLNFQEELPAAQANRWLTIMEIDHKTTGVTPTELRIALEDAGIESRPLWKPMHLQPLFTSARRKGGSNAERQFSIGLCLPSGSAMTDDEIDRTCAVVLNTIRNKYRQFIKPAML